MNRNHKARAYCSLALLAWGSSSRSVSVAAFRSISSIRSSSSHSVAAAAFGTTSSLLVAPFTSKQTTRFSSRRHMSTSNEAATAAAGGEAPVIIDVAGNLADVKARIQAACEQAGKDPSSVRLVAVSKTKPLPLLQQCLDAEHYVMGENYAQELVEKVGVFPDTVHWHFIGGLQSNKANMLVGAFKDSTVDRLTIETVTSLKLANKLNKAIPETDETKLKIFVQVNTSGEESKSGIEPADCATLCKEITANCPNLQLQGLMTIGAVGDASCFTILSDCRDTVAAALGRTDLELSMGMSGDFEAAIAAGATNVRVGSTIFGARDYSNQA